MNKWVWYALVLVAVMLLILSMLTGQFILSIVTLALVLFLKRYYHTIPLPAFMEKHRVYSSVTGKIYEPTKSKK